MPDTECPRCHKTALIRSENVIKGDRADRHYYCGSCNHSWALDEDGSLHRTRDEPPERSRGIVNFRD